MTVVKNQNDRYPKWPLSKMTVNFAPKWPMFQNDRYLYQNDRYFIPKWPLFGPKWPLFLVFQVTVILDNPKWPLIEIFYDQNDRFFDQNDRYCTKMTVMNQNDRYWSPKWPLWFPKMTVMYKNDRFRAKMTVIFTKMTVISWN